MKNPPSGLFLVIFCAFALVMILTGVFQNRNYYDKNVYFGLTGLILGVMWVLSFFQIFAKGFGDILTGFVLVGIITAAIIYIVYYVNIAFKKFKSGVKIEIFENELPDNYKRRVQAGYVSIILFFSSRALFIIFNGTIWVLLAIILISSAFLLLLYSTSWLNKKIRTYPKLGTHYLLITGSFTVFILLNLIIRHLPR